MNFVKIEANRDCYAPTDVSNTMTVGELIEFLDCNFNEDDPVILSHDNGYTYGGITAYDIDSACYEEEY